MTHQPHRDAIRHPGTIEVPGGGAPQIVKDPAIFDTELQITDRDVSLAACCPPRLAKIFDLSAPTLTAASTFEPVRKNRPD